MSRARRRPTSPQSCPPPQRSNAPPRRRRRPRPPRPRSHPRRQHPQPARSSHTTSPSSPFHPHRRACDSLFDGPPGAVMSSDVSPLAPTNVPFMPEVAGVKLATGAAGIKYKDRTDVLLALFDPGTTVAGVLTRSKCPSAPVDWCRARLKRGKARALVVNSGNANAFTGKTGRQATLFTAKLAAKAADCVADDIFLASTGVIGEPLPAQRFAGVMENLVADAKPDRWLAAARAIMTTDTF